MIDLEAIKKRFRDCDNSGCVCGYCNSPIDYELDECGDEVPVSVTNVVDIPALIEEVEKLRRENKALRQAHRDAMGAVATNQPDGGDDGN